MSQLVAVGGVEAMPIKENRLIIIMERGFPKGENQKTLMNYIWLYARCPECGAENRILVRQNNTKRMKKCTACGQIFDIGVYRVIAHANYRIW